MNREALTAILNATRDEKALYLSDGSYIDWTSQPSDGTRSFEVGDTIGQAVIVNLSRADMEALVHRLAATLLAD